jgi:hypothetical protein
MTQRDEPIRAMSNEERESVWDDAYVKEEGIVLEFNLETHSGKVRSLLDGGEYKIDSRELVRTKIELHAGDKILFVPIEDPEGDDYARIIRIIELNA